MIRSDVWGRLDSHASSILEMWCDVELSESRKTIGERFSASMSEVGEFLQLMLGQRKYEEVIKEKRIIFIKKIVADRSEQKKNKQLIDVENSERDITVQMVPLRVRMIGDFHEDELTMIHKRLLTRITERSQWKKRKHKSKMNQSIDM